MAGVSQALAMPPLLALLSSFAAEKSLGEFPGDSCSIEKKKVLLLFTFLPKSGLSCFQSKEVKPNVMEEGQGGEGTSSSSIAGAQPWQCQPIQGEKHLRMPKTHTLQISIP